MIVAFSPLNLDADPGPSTSGLLGLADQPVEGPSYLKGCSEVRQSQHLVKLQSSQFLKLVEVLQGVAYKGQGLHIW